MKRSWITENLKTKYPIILAPMFLVSNEEMLIAAAKAGIAGCIPSLNYRTPEEFKSGLESLSSRCPGAFGVNLIVNQSNPHLNDHIKALKEKPVSFVITSLGSPKEVIKELKPLGTKIICDVVDVAYAKKVEKLGADAIIAVNSGAGGHAGKIPASILIPMLKENCGIPVIAAGGVGTGSALLSMEALGAEGASIGSPYIASTECGVNQDYKDAVVNYGAADIVLSTKISGTPCTVINTPYVKKIGTEQNFVESILSKNKQIKKYAKMLTFYKGMKALEKAAFSATYKKVFCAGPSIEFSEKIEDIQSITDRFVSEYSEAYKKLVGQECL